MGFKEDLVKESQEILDWKIEVTDTKSVPKKADLTYGSTAKRFETAVLYADVRGSSKIPEAHLATTGAKIFNAFLNAAVRIVRRRGGHVRSFNGDSILVFFDPTSSGPATAAVRSGMELKYYVSQMLKPKIKAKGYEDNFNIGIGVDYGKIITTKIGLRGEDNNDLIWPATAVNFAAKLGDKCEGDNNLGISETVYDRMNDEVKYNVKTENGREIKTNMWTPDTSFEFAGVKQKVYKTAWYWGFE